MGKYFKNLKPYYVDSSSAVYLSDTFDALADMYAESIDMVFADPPYFLSNGGISCSGGKAVSVNKGEWDKVDCLEEKHAFNRRWIRLCRHVLKSNGSIWISGTLHNIYSVGMALEQEGYKIINNITWQKTNPPPNLACRCFTHSTETILWARKDDKKSRHYFNYEWMKEINGGRQMQDVWSGALTAPSEKKHGRHPTQKPIYLLERILLASTRESDVVLDPFCGSSTTGVACKRLKRNYIGIDNNEGYIKLSIERLKDV